MASPNRMYIVDGRRQWNAGENHDAPWPCEERPNRARPTASPPGRCEGAGGNPLRRGACDRRRRNLGREAAEVRRPDHRRALRSCRAARSLPAWNAEEMKVTFADSAYFMALLNARDDHHARAKQLAAGLQGRILTTIWALTEVADAFCKPGQRDTAAAFLADLLADDRVIVVPPSLDLFNRGRAFYSQRLDKEWSLTDCISFVVMQEHGLTEALAADKDFRQAGFATLL